MKYSVLAIILVFVVYLSSCKKYIQQQEENAIVSAVTNGVWFVEDYMQNDSDITTTFSGYLFKFDANGTVTGTKDSLSVKGTWSANIGARTISSNFPAVGLPLRNLNETWKITDSYTNFVVANSHDSVYATSNILQLQKQ
jgi:hypothetical protein